MNAEPHVLIVDDDRRIRELIKAYLGERQFRVTTAASAAEAREKMRGLSFDVVVLDVMMPGESGTELTSALRASGAQVPILILSALADTEDRIRGLLSGSDDYLPKPFEPRELLLRINNLVRRSQVADVPTDVSFGGYSFNLARGELRRDGEVLRLTARERDILRLLAQARGEALSRLDLAQPGATDSGRSVDVQINRLRQKIEDDPSNPVYIQTVRGAGYVLHAN